MKFLCVTINQQGHVGHGCLNLDVLLPRARFHQIQGARERSSQIVGDAM